VSGIVAGPSGPVTAREEAGGPLGRVPQT
jgi:hypothetical protein